MVDERKAGLLQPVVAGVLAAVVGFGSSFAVVLQGLSAVGASPAETASGLFALPQGELQTLRADLSRTAPVLSSDPLAGRVKWRMTRAATQ